MDVLSNFLEECCDVEEGQRTEPGVLYEAYKNYCGQYGEYQMNQRAFSQRLMEKGFVKKRSSQNGGFEWHGIWVRI
jgi:putative DNA primase/helicase